MADDDLVLSGSIGPEWKILNAVMPFTYPLLRLFAGVGLIAYASAASQERRLFSGLLTAVYGFFLVYTYLEPLFAPVGSEVAMVFLCLLGVLGSGVAMSLGVLLPALFPGACFGASLALFIGSAIGISNPYYFPVIGGACIVVFTFASIYWKSSVFVTLATSLEAGAMASCLVMQQMLPHLMNVTRGYPYHGDSGTHESYANVSFQQEMLLSLVWAAATVLTAAAIVYRDGSYTNGGLFQWGYTPIMTNDNGSAGVQTTPAPATHRDIGNGQTDAFNMFDPADLPPRLAEYANMVYSACEDLGNFFGFQDSSVRSQAEHLLILLSNNRRYMSSHILPPSVQPPSPIHALHAKVFSNYVKWCRAMGVLPHFSKMNTSMNAPPAVASRVVDLVLFFCVWGEASNLRHVPECLWFLYHKMMEEYIRSEGFTQTRSLYAGHFLDNVIAPIYSVMAKSFASDVDEDMMRNYDDYNEFFWSRNCLRYRYSYHDDGAKGDTERMNALMGPLPGEVLPPVADGLSTMPKTFLEKRSWLRSVLALSRILEWHVVTFYALAVIAFARALVWGWVYSLQVASGVFWLFNALHLTWALLEVWSSYPGVQLTGTDVCGSVFVVVARFLTLVYQTLYLMWAFSPQKGIYLGIEADSTFWWWQYVWLSLLVMIPYFVEALLQIAPCWAHRIWTSQNDYVQSFLNILYPLSRLYVGKDVQESFGHVVVYAIFWITLMVWKLFFSYVFEVYSMVLPTLQLVDDYLNFPDQSFTKMSLLLTMRWLPQFTVYIVDMSIWYAVWQAFAGTSVGFSDHLGDVRSIDDIRMNFGQAPEHFCKKMLSPDAGSRRGSSASFLGSTNNLSESAALLGSDPHRLQSYVNRLLDVRIQKWVMFSAAWNEIIDHFRTEDIISNQERDNLKFSQFDGFSQAIYLPVFQTAGVIDDVMAELERPPEEYTNMRTGQYTDETFFKPIAEHVTMQTAVAEVWELGSYLLVQVLGKPHSSDINAMVAMVNKWVESGKLSEHMTLVRVRNTMGYLQAAISILDKGIQKRKPKTRQKRKATENKPPAQAGMRRVVSAGSFTSLETDGRLKDAKNHDDEPSQMETEIIDALRDQLRDKLRSFFHSVKTMLKNGESNAESRDVLDRLTFLGSMENGFFWNDVYASAQLDDCSKNVTFKSVLKKMNGLCNMHPDDAEPKSKDVRRRLTFFVNTLFMDMPDAPSIHDMFSWNVLTPYYSEDVTYSKSDLERRTSALGVSTLLYLQTLYRTDWNNFLERMGIDNDEKIWSKKHVDETRRWASLRSQTLSRTVHGMMYNEKALRLLANLERLDEDTTNDLLGEKFGYVVACQVYGNMRRNQDPKADDIELLMHQYPHMRVAYIDTIRLNRSGASTYYSVLVKSDGKGQIQEIYRVRLPGNPVIGEGKPENQNHAMIFTRGEFVQTIDMNQEFYFEEALKMRNCLQEFAKREGPLPTTILGLREHIFTGSVSSLSNYMALQEMSFVTLGQRVLYRPLHMRLHYGHPDVFDKLFFITRGGISKASKGINLSEDIFAGYNNVVRGGSVAFKEYVQVGKGRDVGMSQIYKFEAKLSQGAAEQSLSRDVYRMCLRLDFFRLLSFYYGGIGHYFSNVLTVLTVYIVVYLMAVLAIYDLEKIGDRLITPMGTIQMLLGGLGLLQTIPLFATLGVERGWWTSLREIFLVFVTGGPLHFMFHIQTKAMYMAQTILVGGAKYRPTGRGFVTQHAPFDEQFRFFAASHLYLGVELACGLILMGVYTDAKQYWGRSWSLWLASASFLCSPFWFNPLTFDWNTVCSDYDIWMRWMRGSSGGAIKSWSMWWNEENAFYKNMPVMSKSFFMIKCALYVLVGEGIRRSSLFRKDMSLNQSTVSITHVLIFIFTLLVISRIFGSRERFVPYPIRRTVQILLFSGIVAGVATLFIEDSNYIRLALAAYYYIGAICLVGLLYGFKFVKPLYLVHDIVCGHIIFVPLFALAAMQLPGMIQTWLLYHNALSTDVVVSDILRYARRTQENGGAESSNEELTEQVSELRKIVQRQENLLVQAGFGAGDINTSTNTFGQVTGAHPSPYAPGAPQGSGSGAMRGDGGGRSYGRAFSMSGMDVWRDMALGDTETDGFDAAAQQPVGTGTMTMPRSSALDGFSFSQPDTMPPR
ncbi:hypothetical protein MPSEU_001097400 [Mayamaea pseudoterrestris]|nr:hypothetical protein MPSEU_001097400 [Mayamaea pseudoterrestris]